MYSVAPLAVLVVIASHTEGCSTVSDTQVMISAKEARDFLKAGDKTVKSFQGVTGVNVRQVPGPTADIASVAAQPLSQSTLVGTIKLRPSALESKRFGDFLSARITGVDVGSFVSNTSEDARGTMTVRAAFSHAGAGTACVQLSGTATDHMRKFQGTFTILGGTGRAARLHAGGTFRAIQPAPYSNQYQIAFYTTPSFGRSRAMPRGCGQPKAPSTGRVTATFSGFALATGSPSPSTHLYSDGSTISGPVACGSGASLYGMLQYQGPSSVLIEAAAFGPGGTHVQRQNAHPGLNALRLVTAPPNGSYSIKISLSSSSSQVLLGNTAFTPTVTLARTC